MSSPTVCPVPHAVARRAARRGRLRRLCIALLILIVGGELATRLYYWMHKGAPPFSTRTVWYAFYPELRTSGVETVAVSNTDEFYDVLLLGGSVISPLFGDVGGQLEAGLRARLGQPVRVFNLAAPAHTSRDSLLKYRSLARQRFDLVIVYHGINDTRMNNCPPEMFRADYTHCAWYRQLQRYEESPLFGRSVLAFSLAQLGDRLSETLALGQFLPRSDPPEEWRRFGGDIKTRAAFQANIDAILTIARSKGERVVLMTFAHHVPANYSLDAFRAKTLDYAAHDCPLEVWGTLANVLAGLKAHNDVIREFVARCPEVVFIDQDALLPKTGRYFDDCCHLTALGCTAFTRNVLAALCPD